MGVPTDVVNTTVFFVKLLIVQLAFFGSTHVFDTTEKCSPVEHGITKNLLNSSH